MRKLRNNGMVKTIFSSLLIAGSFFVFAVFAFAESVSVTASVDRNSVSLNEYIGYSVTVSADESSLPEPQLGDLSGFNRYGSGKSQNISIVNGKVNASVTYSYTLGPKSAGKFTIPPSSVTYKGKVYSTQPIEVDVAKAQAQSSQNVSVAQPQSRGARQVSRPAQSQNIQGKVFVKASVNKKTVYQNEKLVYKFSFYSNVALASNPEYFAPDFSGFWNDGSKPSNRIENIDGAEYSVSEVETLLYPIETGNKTISPTRLKIAVMDFSSPSSLDDFFGSFFQGMGQRQVKTLESEEIKIRVLPLPQENRPADFYGAIGDFKISSSLDKTSAAVNEPATLTLRVSGSGNMKSVSKIDFDVKDGFRKYDTVVSDISSGGKEFKTILVPVSPGEKTIPPVKLSFFNPAKKKYETVETKSLTLNVSGEAVYDEEPSAAAAKTSTIKKDINYNKRITDIKSYRGYYVINKKFYMLFIPFVLLFAASKIFVFMRLKRAENNETSQFKKAKKFIARAEIEISKENFDAARDFIYKALSSSVNARLKSSFENLRKEQISKKMLEAEIPQEIVKDTRAAFETLDFLRFASVKADKPRLLSLLETVKKIMSELK
jgi:hypothetical protein